MIPHHNVPVSFSAMFNCLGQLYSETIQICSGVAFILLEMNAWGNNAQVCKHHRPWGSTRVGGALCLLKTPFTGCLSLSLFPLWCAYVVDSWKSCQIVMFLLSVSTSPQWNSRLRALGLFFYDVRENASYPERQKSSLWHTKRVTDLPMALLICSLFVHSTKQLNIVRTQLWAKQCSASC